MPCVCVSLLNVLYSIPQYMAAACIFLAGKIEESPRRLRDIVNVFNHIKQKRMNRYGTQ